jgi:ornithine carbamoyltransferase
MLRHFVSQLDLGSEEVSSVFSRTSLLKPARASDDLTGKTLVMFFEKSSTRTRLSFEIGMTQLGGHAVYFDRESSQLSRGESIRDTAEVISRYADLVMARVISHQTVLDLAKHSQIPVINGLSDEEHPCQSMADLFTMLEKKDRLDGLEIAYVGDGNNNVTHSLMLACARTGARIRVASPRGLEPKSRYVAAAREAGASVELTQNPADAVTGADVVYTDVWVSMGREAERSERLELLHPYQINAELVSHAHPDFLFMHCLPAHIGEEVTEEIAYGPNSVMFDQAENRLHVQKALMLFLHNALDGAEA